MGRPAAHGALWLAAIFTLIACGDSVTPTTDAGADVAVDGDGGGSHQPSEPYIEIGTGARSYETLTCGESIPIIEGVQGGYHVWGGFSGVLPDPDELSIAFSLSVDGEEVARADYIDDAVSSPDGVEYAGVAVVLYAMGPEELDGREATLQAEVTTADGTRLDDAVTVVPRCCEL